MQSRPPSNPKSLCPHKRAISKSPKAQQNPSGYFPGWIPFLALDEHVEDHRIHVTGVAELQVEEPSDCLADLESVPVDLRMRRPVVVLADPHQLPVLHEAP